MPEDDPVAKWGAFSGLVERLWGLKLRAHREKLPRSRTLPGRLSRKHSFAKAASLCFELSSQRKHFGADIGALHAP